MPWWGKRKKESWLLAGGNAVWLSCARCSTVALLLQLHSDLNLGKMELWLWDQLLLFGVKLSIKSYFFYILIKICFHFMFRRLSLSFLPFWGQLCYAVLLHVLWSSALKCNHGPTLCYCTFNACCDYRVYDHLPCPGRSTFPLEITTYLLLLAANKSFVVRSSNLGLRLERPDPPELRSRFSSEVLFSRGGRVFFASSASLPTKKLGCTVVTAVKAKN